MNKSPMLITIHQQCHKRIDMCSWRVGKYTVEKKNAFPFEKLLLKKNVDT